MSTEQINKTLAAFARDRAQRESKLIAEFNAAKAKAKQEGGAG